MAIVAAGKAGRVQSHVATHFWRLETVSRLLQRLEDHNSLTRSPQSGRSKILSPRDLRAVTRRVRLEWHVTNRDLINSMPSKVSRRTLHDALGDYDLRKYKAKKNISLSPE